MKRGGGSITLWGYSSEREEGFLIVNRIINGSVPNISLHPKHSDV